MVRPIADLEGHPDLAELRAHYDQVSETPTARITEDALVLAGIYLAVSPWVLAFPPAEFNLTVNNLICGIAVAALGASFAIAYGRTHGLTWVPVVIGIWALIAPWVVLRGTANGGTIANNVITGAITIVLGLMAMRLATGGGLGGRGRGFGGKRQVGERPGFGDRDRPAFGDRERAGGGYGGERPGGGYTERPGDRPGGLGDRSGGRFDRPLDTDR